VKFGNAYAGNTDADTNASAGNGTYDSTITTVFHHELIREMGSELEDRYGKNFVRIDEKYFGGSPNAVGATECSFGHLGLTVLDG
jgi:hypothetical protein